MISKPFAILNLPTDPLHKDFVLPTIPADSRPYRHVIVSPSQILNSDILDSFKSFNLKVYYVMLFYKRAGNSGKIHTDCHWYNNKWHPIVAGVNYVINHAPSLNCWFDTNEIPIQMDINNMPKWLGATHGNHSNANLDFEYITGSNYFPNTEGSTPVYSTDVQKPTLFRTDIPHTTVNSDTVDRWSISIRFDTWNELSWNQYLDKFNSIILD